MEHYLESIDGSSKSRRKVDPDHASVLAAITDAKEELMDEIIEATAARPHHDLTEFQKDLLKKHFKEHSYTFTRDSVSGLFDTLAQVIMRKIVGG